jgi:hypothetical protein
MTLDVAGTRWGVRMKVDLLERWREVADKIKAFLSERIQQRS